MTTEQPTVQELAQLVERLATQLGRLDPTSESCRRAWQYLRAKQLLSESLRGKRNPAEP